MSHLNGLGGRLPLLEPAKLQPEQRELYDKIIAGITPSADAAGFRIEDEQARLIGPFNATLYNPEMGGSFLALQKMESEHTSLSKTARQVVILTVGSLWRTPYALYAHAAQAAKAGLSAQQIEALTLGQSAEGLNTEDFIAHRFTHQLVSHHVVHDSVYAEARKIFGDQGIVEMLVLIGCYLSVCALLNAFAVPAPDPQPTT